MQMLVCQVFSSAMSLLRVHGDLSSVAVLLLWCHCYGVAVTVLLRE